MDDKTLLCIGVAAITFWLGARYGKQQRAQQQASQAQAQAAAEPDAMTWFMTSNWSG